MIICRVSDNTDIRVVFSTRTDHSRAADINIFNTGFEICTCGNGLGKGVQISHDHINRRDVMLVQCVKMF